jgi:predicted O-linked N-acetylglucosamine transferase (SPINDLY family)
MQAKMRLTQAPKFIAQALHQGDYAAALDVCEQAIAQSPDDRQLYWYYGLALLLNGDPEGAEATWWMVLADAGDAAEAWRSELSSILSQVAIDQVQTNRVDKAHVIREAIAAIDPDNCENLLYLLDLSIQRQILDAEQIEQWAIIPSFRAISTQKQLNSDLILGVLETYLANPLIHPITIDLADALLHLVQNQSPQSLTFAIDRLLEHSYKIAHLRNYPKLSFDLGEVAVRYAPEHFELWLAQADFAMQDHVFDIAIAAAKEASRLASSPIDQIAANRACLQAALSSGQQDTALAELVQAHHSAIAELLRQAPTLDRDQSYRLRGSIIHLPYITDRLSTNRTLQNQVSQYCEQQLQQLYADIYQQHLAAHSQKCHQTSEADRRLKVGYICRYFQRHSVGWLARTLLQNHHPDQIELYIYFLQPQKQPDSVQQQYLDLPAQIRLCPPDLIPTATQIHQDDLDILVELDSLTSQLTCEIMALKPSPIQASWLGWDATGMNTIDYFIADPYVLPESAQADYPETIIRLPQTYIAVDHFEVGQPSVTRQQLNLSETAVLFMSAQRGYKRHPAMMQLQMQILQQVPDSYLLIKGLADQAVVKSAFWDLAQQMDVAPDRLIFLDLVESEEIHRANLAIADVILDTYPYNGATTTLEALWMEKPLVTRVGEQFAARNSYTMLKNVGVEVGIAWTDAEYVEWGVKLGLDPNLRQQVMNQLKQAKQHAPLWDGQSFARSMEAAYKTMWEKFQASN